MKTSPRKAESKYRTYTAEVMLEVVRAVKEQGGKVKMAARKYRVPETTLRDIIAGRINPDNFHRVKLFKEEELVLVDMWKPWLSWDVAIPI